MDKKTFIKKWFNHEIQMSVKYHGDCDGIMDDINTSLDQLINSVRGECAKIAERIEPRFANVTTIDINAYAKEHGSFIAKAIRNKKC